jgi:hypothetical protein
MNTDQKNQPIILYESIEDEIISISSDENSELLLSDDESVIPDLDDTIFQQDFNSTNQIDAIAFSNSIMLSLDLIGTNTPKGKEITEVINQIRTQVSNLHDALIGWFSYEEIQNRVNELKSNLNYLLSII